MSAVTPIHRPREFRQQPLDLLDALEHEPPEIDFVLPAFIAGTVGGLIAAGASGKTWVALQLGILIASGVDTLGIGGYPTGRVTYIAAEDPVIALHHRLFALGSMMDRDDREAVAENFVLQPAIGDDIDIRDPRWRERICFLGEGSRLLILDTLRRLHRGDENKNDEMGQVVDALEKIAVETGASVLFLHHTSKAAALSGMGDVQQAGRGSSVLVDNTRWQSYLQTMTWEQAKEFGVDDENRRQYVRFGVSKPNYGAPPPPGWYRRTGHGLEPVTMIRREKPTGRWVREF